MFLIVEFTNERKMCNIVLEKWFTPDKTRCCYPFRFKEKKYDEALLSEIDCVPLDSAKWKSYSVRVLGLSDKFF